MIDLPAMLRTLSISIALLAGAVQGYDFVRHENAASRSLQAAGQQYLNAPELPAVAAPGAVAAADVGSLLLQHLAAGFALPDDWFTNEDGSVVVLLSEPGCGSIIREFKVYRLREGYYRHTGTYRMLSRAYRWVPKTTRFETAGAGALCLSFISPDGRATECRFDLSRRVQLLRLAPAHAPITPAEERGACSLPASR